MGRRRRTSASEGPTAKTIKVTLQRVARLKKRLDPEAGTLLEAKRVARDLIHAISALAPKDQVVVAKAIVKGGLDERSLLIAFGTGNSPGYQRRILELCKRKAREKD